LIAFEKGVGESIDNVDGKLGKFHSFILYI